jgi:glycosyltransferase involved in cell wall biosynthesis
VVLYASRHPRRPDPLATFGPSVVSSPLPAVALTRAWDRSLLHAPNGFDVVHSPSLAVPPRRRGEGVVMVHDVVWRQLPYAYPPRGRRWHEAALRRALRRATHLVVPSAAVADDVVDAGATRDATSVIPPGCDHLPDPDHEACDAALQRLGISGPFLLSVGTLEPRKNLARLLEGYDTARDALPEPWPLVVVGPQGWGPGIRARPGVVLTGSVSGAVLAALYARARLLVYVPLAEGFGLPPVESMRAGTPVVASPVPSTAGAVLETDALRPDAIAAAIVQGATDEALRAQLVVSGAERAKTLTWRATASAHVELWRSLR